MPKNQTTQTPFGLNLSFVQADPDYAIHTALGIAVRPAVDTPWRIYDRGKHKVIDLDPDNLQADNNFFPVWEGPAIKIKDGDIIKHDIAYDFFKHKTTYYYCVSREGQRLTAIDIATGQKQEIVIPEDALSMNIYRKLFSLAELLSNSTELGDDKLLMMMAIQNGEDIQSNLMSLIFLKGGDFRSDELLMMITISNMMQKQDTNNSLIQLLLMKELLHTPHDPQH